MPDANSTPAYVLDATSPTSWDVLLDGSTVIAGTITKDGDDYVLHDAQNLPVGSYPTLEQARDGLAEGAA